MDESVMPLRATTVAPTFTLAQSPHTRLALRGFRGHPIVLIFYPLDWEPVSREQLTLYEEYSDDFARLGARLLGICVDHPGSHEAFARDAGIHFPLLADFQPRGGVARRYGVYRPHLGVSARALFVLDERGVIRFGKAYPDQLNPGVYEPLTTLEALATGQELEDERRAEPTREC